MKVKLFTILILFLSLSYGFYTVNNGDDTKKAPISNQTSQVNYQEYVYGPALDKPLSVISESFESTTFPPAGWVKISPVSGSTGWSRQILGTSPVPGFQGGTIFTPPGGGVGLAFCNYITGNGNNGSSGVCDQWLVSPQITNVQPNDSLTFYFWKFGTYKDNLIIRISTTTPTIAGMTIRIDSIGSSVADSGWVQKKYRIGNLVPAGSNIYIGFREWCAEVTSDGACYALDLVNTTVLTGVNTINTKIPATYNLSQNYPNPFNPVTKINFELPKSGFVTLKLYSILGEEVKTIVNQEMNAGTYSVNFDGSALSSGTYFYKLESNGFAVTKKMLLVK